TTTTPPTTVPPPTSTTSPATTSTPTPPATTPPPGADDAAEPATPPPTAPPPPVPPPPDDPVLLSVDVVVDDQLDEVDDLIGRLGRDAIPQAFQEPIDGILIDDVRPAISIGDDGTALLRLVIGTDTAPSEADRLRVDQPGLYPVLVTLRADGAFVARHGTVLHRTAARPEVAPVAIATVTAVPQPSRLVDGDELDGLVEQAARVAEFAEATDAPLLVSIPPRVVTDLTIGTSAGAIVTESLRDDTVQALPATPFDISSAVAVDRDDSFVRQLTAGEEQLQVALAGVPIRRDVWLVDHPISIEAAALLRTLGVRALAMTEEVAEATLDPTPDDPARDRFIELPLGDGASMPVLVIDDTDTPFGTATADDVLRDRTLTEWTVGQLARLHLGVVESGLDAGVPRGRLLAAPGLGPLDPVILDELVRLDSVSSLHDVVDAATLPSRVGTQRIEPVPSLPEQAGPSLDDRLASIGLTNLVLANAASMLPVDDARPTEWTRVLDALVSTAYSDDDARIALDGLEAEADQLTRAIVAPTPFSLTLTSRRETIPLSIGNTSDDTLTVRIELSSPRLAFPEGDREVVLAPDSTTEIEIPVEARSNGTTSVEVRIVTPFGEPLAEPIRVSTRVQALSGVAQLVTATLILLLLTWWFSHWRARRRENGGEPVASVDP
ncbi:MAG: DUF6049 family protein, partial [Actinomycetota bacterium]